MQRDLLAGAQEMIARNPELLDHTAVVLSQRDWHPGLLGIVAGQLAEQYRRPCVLLSESAEGEVARGSARSSPGYDIGAALAQVADLLIAFGGHPGAAGMSLKVKDVARFRRRLSQVLKAQYRPAAVPVLDIAAMISLSEVTDGLAMPWIGLAPLARGILPWFWPRRRFMSSASAYWAASGCTASWSSRIRIKPSARSCGGTERSTPCRRA